MLNGEQIQANLRAFVARWRDYSGSEIAGSQTFLTELFAAYGNTELDVAQTFENTKAAQGRMDLYLEGICIIEMKAPGERDRLLDHRKQALDYWNSSASVADHREAPKYVLLCSFNRFEVFEPGRNPREPLAVFDLDDLVEHYETLMFLAGHGVQPLFGEYYRAMTTEAAKSLSDLYHALSDRRAADATDVQRFILQIAWCLFAEDLGMLGGHPVQRIIERLIGDPTTSSYAELGALFDVLGQDNDYGRRGILEGTVYVNGSLFERPARVHLEPDELALLRAAAEFDWRGVDPTIFGSLMEGCLGRDQRWKLGAHYTHEADIMRIVGPTIVRPWRERIDAAVTVDEALAALRELTTFRVLDPACGCGNFLYVAYREIRGLEFDLKARIADLARRSGQQSPDVTGLFVPLTNMQGLEIEPIVAQIARVTLWMGHKQVSDRYGTAEPVLPLVTLSSIQTCDALASDWPDTDAIIGNPPFLGSQHVRGALGDDYIEWLKKQFKVGVKDFCVYWFRKAHDHLKPGQRAGLVGTNSVSQNRARSASLQHITDEGGVITDAVSSQKWPGEAKVHVSLVNWVKQPATEPTDLLLDGEPVDGITAELRDIARSTAAVTPLAANKGKCFQGPIPVGDGFIISEDEAKALLADDSAPYAQVVRPYLTGDDIANDPAQAPSRWIIDFFDRPLESAMDYSRALEIVRERVKPTRDTNNRPARRDRWWQFGELARGLRSGTSSRHRWPVANRVGKRLTLAWCDPATLASDKAQAFAFDDDFSMGLLLSKAHDAWAWARSSTLKSDLNYTPTTVFMTFPFPDPVTDAQRDAVAAASVALLARRSEICLAEKTGLTTLYNRMDDGAYADLRALHKRLDEAVADCYGWPKSIAQDADAIVQKLVALNVAITNGERAYDPFGTLAAASAREAEATLDLG